MDEPIHVRPYPMMRTFRSLEAALGDAKSHARLPKANQDTGALAGSLLVDGFWGLYEWVLRFDTGLHVRIWPDGAEVNWQLLSVVHESTADHARRVGSLPIRLQWPNQLGIHEMDGSALIAKRRGARFYQLFVNEMGLFVYFRGHLILIFQSVAVEADGTSVLYASEGD
jgi:hypothetical protein